MDVYGGVWPWSSTNKEEFWVELKEMRNRWLGSWVVGDNSNVIRFVHKKNSRRRITHSMMRLEDFVKIASLQDIPLCNANYTWTNGQDELVVSRLDKFLVSREWEEFYPLYFQEAMPEVTSDHWPIMMHTTARSFGPKL